ncbi:hypothetical protein [Nocardia sp. AG03]|uniref:hypothetical protein n=1 Tax=Nocardia sp. AG03 TaxID=3025312 RepID=UPI002418AA5A|nr:hypothetical protein [Nocardia sp. AG03]
MTMARRYRRSGDLTTRDTPPSWKLGAEGAADGELAALGVPAVVLSGVLVFAGVASLAWLPSLAAEYGGPVPVASIVALHVILSAALGIWGIGQRRRR